MFSNRIKEARERQKMTQKMLALRLGIAQTTVSGWENGSKRPSVDTIVQISDILGVSTDYLLEKTDSPFSIVQNDASYLKLRTIFWDERIIRFRLFRLIRHT